MAGELDRKPGISPRCLRTVAVLALIEVLAAMFYLEVVLKW